MDGMAKSAPVAGVEQKAPEHVDAEAPLMIDGIPLDLIYHYDVDIRNVTGKAKKQLQEIMQLAPGETFRQKMREIMAIERKIGAPGYEETRYGKVWNWLRISSMVRRQHHGK